MGGDIANVKNSNLKVPPLKIVLSSAASGGSDSSSSTSPSSESESLDSNLTIISDNQHDKSASSKSSDQKEDTAQAKQERTSRNSAKGSTSDRHSSASNTLSGGKRSNDNNGSDANNSETVASREQTSSSTQRITRSSQRAAQQSKPENLHETNGDEAAVSETQDKVPESARKVKRRKGEPQDSEQDNNQQVPPPAIVMANICPADYELPAQNSFELYRDIRKRPYKKLMKLINIQPKAPHGFKDYLLNSGPYLLDGNRIGGGMRGASGNDKTEPSSSKSSRFTNRMPPKLKYTANHSKFSAVTARQQRQDYDVPTVLEAPRNLKHGSPLYELFQDQERSRQRMRMQHLKERERSVLTAEQEILRAYNKPANDPTKQDLNLSACTYFYLQERYHYIDDKNESIDCINPKDLLASKSSTKDGQTENDETSRVSSNDNELQNSVVKTSQNPPNLASEVRESNEHSEKQQADEAVEANPTANGPNDTKSSQKKRKRAPDCHNDDEQTTQGESRGQPGDTNTTNGKTCDKDAEAVSNSKPEPSVDRDLPPKCEVDRDRVDEDARGLSAKAPDIMQPTLKITDAEQLVLNKSVILQELQEIDEKWAKIKKEMLIRHKNEADSLFAVQSLDWEWKAKEIGACDVRVALKIEPELVPRVEVSALDY